MSEKPLRLWAVVIGTKGRHRRYVNGYPRPKTFFTREEARTYKYNQSQHKDMHVVPFIEQILKGE